MSSFINYDSVAAQLIKLAEEDAEPRVTIGLKTDPSLWARNEFVYYMEDFTRPITPEERARWAARDREAKRLRNRLRAKRRFVVRRLKDAWGVLLHGLPESDW